MTTVPVRIMVLDIWDGFGVEVASDLPVSDLKAQALALAKVEHDPREYLIKFRGAEVKEQGRTLAEAGIVPNAELIVMRRRRIPAK
jgi:hypothetical protein